MNPSEFNSTGGSRNPPPSSSLKYPKRNESHPIVPPKVSQESHKIKKPPLVPSSPAGIEHHHTRTANTQKKREPKIIYQTEPKVITVYSAADFKELAQRLTGLPRGEDEVPAARVASIERTTGMSIKGTEVGPFPGAISPVPTTMSPVVPSGFSMPEKETVPFSEVMWSSVSRPMDSQPVTETVPLRDELRSAHSRPIYSMPLPEPVPFRDEFRSAHSRPMGSLPVRFRNEFRSAYSRPMCPLRNEFRSAHSRPINSIPVPFRNEFRSAHSRPINSMLVPETVPFRDEFRSVHSRPMDSLPVPFRDEFRSAHSRQMSSLPVPFRNEFRSEHSRPINSIQVPETVPFRDEFRSAHSRPMGSMPVTETVPFRDEFRSVHSRPMDYMRVPEMVPFGDEFQSAHSRPMDYMRVPETVPFRDVLWPGNSSLPNQSSGSLSSAIVSSPPVTESDPFSTFLNSLSSPISCDVVSSSPPSPPISPTQEVPDWWFK
ncbi:hypothetical protein TanjilG_31872 [Lupinus angustifolius]|uniref:VQ domain-containing protein n=1 Tax=Lupinus angustifolius TaxID=3871 RepID=A0A1J7G9G3_LUPAN|nr:hypothetical protein TanjilG_31872 [Lupinus angustifolius]